MRTKKSRKAAVRLLISSGFSGPVCFLLADGIIVRQTHKIVKGGTDAFAVRPRRLTHSWSEYVNERRLQRAFAFARDSVASKLSLSLLRELKVAGGKEGHQSTAE